MAHRLGRVSETLTRQSGWLEKIPAYDSWLLSQVLESQQRRRMRIQTILTVLVGTVHLIGIGVAMLLVTLAIPANSVFANALAWVKFVVRPAYFVVALAFGAYIVNRRTLLALH